MRAKVRFRDTLGVKFSTRAKTNARTRSSTRIAVRSRVTVILQIGLW
jgi:hypothetical protein